MFVLLSLAIIIGVISGHIISNESKTLDVNIRVEIVNELGRKIRNTQLSVELPLVAKQLQEINVENRGTIPLLSKKQTFTIHKKFSLILDKTLEQHYLIGKHTKFKFNASDSIAESALKLRKQYNDLRVISGLTLSDKTQKPKCWIQIKNDKNEPWMTLTDSKLQVLALKEIQLTDLTEFGTAVCQNAIVDIWGASVKDVRITLSES
ncbi:hypothetical protein JQC92_13255 [Shewanella sp. 202IG2-18]|nr:hypothetical protein [Parashewanella hymeniacidonis]